MLGVLLLWFQALTVRVHLADLYFFLYIHPPGVIWLLV